MGGGEKKGRQSSCRYPYSHWPPLTLLVCLAPESPIRHCPDFPLFYLSRSSLSASLLLLQRVLPRCRECVSSPSFKQRQLGLHMTQTLIACHVFDPPAITEQVLPLLLSAAEDR